MRGFIICLPILVLALCGPASALTLYKCVLLDGSGVVYQDYKPSEAECAIEERDVDPDANVIPAAKFTRQEEPPAQPEERGANLSGAPDREERGDMLITGEEDELAVDDPANLPVNEPPRAPSGVTAPPGGTAGTGTTAPGGIVAPPAPLPPAGVLGP